MSQSDFENKIRGIIHTIRVAIKPELAIPSDEASHPINYRITRLRSQLSDLKKNHEQISASIANISTNLEGLLEEINSNDDPQTPSPAEAPTTKEEKPKSSKSTAKKNPKKTTPKDEK